MLSRYGESNPIDKDWDTNRNQIQNYEEDDPNWMQMILEDKDTFLIGAYKKAVRCIREINLYGNVT